MINNLQIAGLHAKFTKEEEAYVTKKIGPMDRYIPKKARDAVKAEVKLKEEKSKDKSKFTCEVVMHLPHGSITVHEKSTTIYAAIDLAEDKLKHQITKYKEKHDRPRLHRRLAAKFTRLSQR